jgi:transposase
VAPGAHALSLCDRAGWHATAKGLRTPADMTLLPLPPYAPELNPMENVWDYLRGNTLCGVLWNSYEAIVQACKKAWHFLVNDPDRIRSIGPREWACVSL